MPPAPALPWLNGAPGLSRDDGRRSLRSPRPFGRRLSPRSRPRWITRRVRRWAAAFLVAAAAVVLVRIVSPPPPPHPVYTAARDLPAGHLLGPSDVVEARVTDPLHPGGAVGDPGRLHGRRLGRSVTAREILTEATLAAAHDLSPAERALHVPVADPGALRVVRPGDRVDLVDAEAGRVVVSGVRVISVDDPGDDAAGHGVVVALPGDRLRAVVPAMSGDGRGVALALRRS